MSHRRCELTPERALPGAWTCFAPEMARLEKMLVEAFDVLCGKFRHALPLSFLLNQSPPLSAKLSGGTLTQKSQLSPYKSQGGLL